MSLLYDRILSEGVRVNGMVNRNTALVPSGPVFLIQNVADYFHTHLYTDSQSWRWDDFPSIAPPFDRFWMEFRVRPEHYPLFPRTSIPVGGRGGVGAWVLECRRTVDEDVPDDQGRVIEMFESLCANGSFGPINITGLEGLSSSDRRLAVFRFLMGSLGKSGIIQDTMQRGLLCWYAGPILGIRWFGIYHSFYDSKDTPPRHIGGIEVLAREDGSPFHLSTEREICGTAEADAGPYAKNMIMDSVLPAFLAISFLHCRNVSRVEQVVPTRLSKAHQKRHGKPLVRYHTLNIEPMKQVLKHEGQSEKTGLKRALHICRGHFAHYTEEKPLFGRTVGTFWKPSHVRGSLEEGIVDKDYRIKEPKS